MTSLLPDLSQIQSPCSQEIPKAITQFQRMRLRGDVNHEESIALAVELSNQILGATMGRESTAQSLLDVHQQEVKGVSQMYPYFPVYACMHEHAGQMQMVEKLYQAYEPFSTFGIVRQQAMLQVQLDCATTHHAAQLPRLFSSDGAQDVKATHLIGLFGQRAFLSSLKPMLGSKEGIERLFGALSAGDLEDRIAVETLAHRLKFESHSSQEVFDTIEALMLPESRACSRNITRMNLLISPVHGAGVARSIADAVESVPELHRPQIFTMLRRSLARVFDTRAMKTGLPIAAKNFSMMFKNLEPLGFDPFESLGAMGVIGTLMPLDMLATAVGRCMTLESREILTFELSWLQGALSTLNADQVLAGKPSIEIASYLYRISEDPRYRPYLLKSDRGRESVFAGDMGL